MTSTVERASLDGGDEGSDIVQQTANSVYSTGVSYSNGKISQEDVQQALADKENGVSTLAAVLDRAEWNEFLEDYLPLIQDRADKIMSGETVQQAVDDARESTAIGFNNAKLSQGLSDERLGVSITADQQAHRNKKMGLSQVASTVSNVNDARVSATDRENAMLAGGFANSLKTESSGEY